jgi:hypothetical protein
VIGFKTYKGEELEIYGSASDGGFARMATKLKLYKSGSTPAKDGTGFTEVDPGYGYTTGGKAVSRANWAYLSGPSRITLADQVWTAAGGSIPDIAGAYLTNAADEVMAWWERTPPLTLLDGESITADDLTVQVS